MHSKAELERLDSITAAVAHLSDILQDGETIEVWRIRGNTHCKVGYEEQDALPVPCLADVGYMLGAVKAVYLAENNKSGVLSDSEYFV